MKEFVDIVLDTDNKVSISELAVFSRSISSKLQKLIDECTDMWGSDFSIFLSGSIAFNLRSASMVDIRVSGETTSDVDIWIVVGDKQKVDLSLFKGYLRGINQAFDDHDMISVKLGDAMQLSIKIVREEVVKEILSFSKFDISVLRTTSLKVVKDHNVFSGFISDYIVPIEEKFIDENRFTWKWEGCPYIENDFVLSDLHSFIIFGNFIHDGMDLLPYREAFLRIWEKAAEEYEQQFLPNNLFKYFKSSFPTAYATLFQSTNLLKKGTLY
jgi:hypothetical protein